MIPDESPTEYAQPGHNLPPSPIDTVREAMEDVLARYRKRCAELIASADAKQVVDRISAGEAGDILMIASTVQKKLDADRLEVTKPFYDASNAGKALADALWDDVDQALQALAGRSKDWHDAEDQRIEAQKREQADFMSGMSSAVQPQAAPRAKIEYAQGAEYNTSRPAPAPPLREGKSRKVRGDLGSVSGNVDEIVYEITDISQIPSFVMNSPVVHEAVKTVLKQMAKHIGTTIPGVETKRVSKLKVNS